MVRKTFHTGSNTQIFILVAVLIISSAVLFSFRESTQVTASPVSLERVSIIPGEKELSGNGSTSSPVFSGDGNYVVFTSSSSNLVPGDVNGANDIFIYSFETDTVELVSLDSNEVQADSDSETPQVSFDGRYVVFASYATNLVSGDTNGQMDVFLRDRQLGTTERINVSSSEIESTGYAQNPSISSDGRYVVFHSSGADLIAGDTNGQVDAFLRDRQLGSTERVSISDGEAQANSESYQPYISSDGRYVAFTSYAPNLVAGDSNVTYDVFVRDLELGTTERVSISDGEAQANSESSYPSLSSDGRYVLFYSVASNLVVGDTNGVGDVFLRDRLAGTTTRVSISDGEAQANAFSGAPSMSLDGRYVVFQSEATNLVVGDINFNIDFFIRDTLLGTTELVTQTTAGVQLQEDSSISTISVSPDGRYVAFDTTGILVPGDSNNAYDIFIRDRQLDTTEFLYTFLGTEEANGGSIRPKMSEDERYIVFESNATNLVADDTDDSTDIFVFDRTERTFELVSVSSDGTESNGEAYTPYISGDGRYVVFSSNATNLVADDTNDVEDIFLRDRFLDTTEIVSLTYTGELANNTSMEPSVSDDGRYVLFQSFATNLVDGDTNGVWDIFIRDRDTDATERVSVSSDGTQASEQSLRPRFSSDGRYVVFTSEATNLVPEDTDDDEDIYIRDRTNGTTKIISYVRNVMVHGNSDNTLPDFDAGQNFVFQSLSSDLVSGDTNNVDDIFFMNQATNQIQRVSVSTNGEEGNALSIRPKISADGRYVSYTSYATNLVAGDTNSATDIFVYDRESNITERVSISTNGEEANNASNFPDISSTGQYVVYTSNATNLVASDANAGVEDIFIRDLNADTTELVSVSTGGVQGDGASSEPIFSSNDQYVGFSSSATNLVAGDTNNAADIFLRDLVNETTEIVSVDSDENIVNGSVGAFNPSLSSDARYVVFSSESPGYVSGDTNSTGDIFIRDRQEGTTVRISTTIDGLEPNGNSFFPEITPDGRYIIFYSYATNFVAGDTNATSDIFVYDRQTNQVTRMDQSTQGVQDTYDDADEGNGFAISDDGRYVLFPSVESTTLILGYNTGNANLLIRDRELQTLTHAINFAGGFKGSSGSGFSTISKNGQYIAFHTEADNLFPNDQNEMKDVIFYDNNTQTLEPVSVSSSEILGNENSYMQETPGRSISDDGRYVAFYSYAPLVSDDTNVTSDIYVRDRQEGTTARVNTSVLGVEQDADDYDDGQGYFLSGDGKYLVYSSSGDTLVASDQNDEDDVFFATLNNTATTSGGGGGGVVFQPASGGLSYVPPALLPSKEIDPSKENPKLIQEKPNTPNIPICNEQGKFTQYVRKGAFGGDVKKIQEFLNERGYLKVTPTGYFGVLTEQAVKAFQLDNRQVTLDPWGFKSPTGWWYHTTRGLANKIIGCPEENVTLPNGTKVSL